MVKLCNDYNIILGHSIAYYPQGNFLVESSNKSIVRIIKKLLQDIKMGWHNKLKYALWEDMIYTNKSIGTSHFQRVYGIDIVFPVSLGVHVMKFLQEKDE